MKPKPPLTDYGNADAELKVPRRGQKKLARRSKKRAPKRK